MLTPISLSPSFGFGDRLGLAWHFCRGTPYIFKHIGPLNHDWNAPSALISLGIITQDEIKQIAGSSWRASLPSEVNIRIK